MAAAAVGWSDAHVGEAGGDELLAQLVFRVAVENVVIECLLDVGDAPVGDRVDEARAQRAYDGGHVGALGLGAARVGHERLDSVVLARHGDDQPSARPQSFDELRKRRTPPLGGANGVDREVGKRRVERFERQVG
ncbi:MAG: hypothetical protein MUF34_00620 [Polyangiaceae bacterium]|jgi:hypothetical protein|nr:hypothetical protein [Polyangiaceae bacterium]